MLYALSCPLAQYYSDYSGIASHSNAYGYDAAVALGFMLLVLTGIIGAVVQNRMLANMKKFSAQPAGMTGAVAARMMLDSYGLHDVKITRVRGMLTDHYNPANRTVNLSDTVYSQATVAAVAVAAHECGHAVQHATAYPWLGLRSQLVPLVNIGSRLGQILLIVGLLLLTAGSGATIAWIGLAFYAATTIFALVTLPVEFNASGRALAWLRSSGVASGPMHANASTALRWAAMTYVAGALSSIAMLLYYASLILSSRSRR